MEGLNYERFRIMEGFELWRVSSYDYKRVSNYGGFELWRVLNLSLIHI